MGGVSKVGSGVAGGVGKVGSGVVGGVGKVVSKAATIASQNMPSNTKAIEENNQN